MSLANDRSLCQFPCRPATVMYTGFDIRARVQKRRVSFLCITLHHITFDPAGTRIRIKISKYYIATESRMGEYVSNIQHLVVVLQVIYYQISQLNVNVTTVTNQNITARTTTTECFCNTATGRENRAPG